MLRFGVIIGSGYRLIYFVRWSGMLEKDDHYNQYLLAGKGKRSHFSPYMNSTTHE